MVGAGVTAQFTDNLKLDLGYTYARGDSRTTITGVDAGNFPAVTSKLNSVKADLTYGVNDRLDVMFSWWYENFDSSDWALQGIGPATLPTVLALGADPYNYSVNYVTLSARYSFGEASQSRKQRPRNDHRRETDRLRGHRSRRVLDRRTPVRKSSYFGRLA